MILSLVETFHIHSNSQHTTNPFYQLAISEAAHGLASNECNIRLFIS